MTSERKDKKLSRLALRFARLRSIALEKWDFLWSGVWKVSSHSPRINIIKTINLSVRSFMSGDLQSQSMAMTYRTLLAVVPSLALLFAIGKGFGLQGVLSDELFKLFPAQRQAITYAMSFIDSYLSSYSEGLFVGVGIVFLLWTLISLLGSTEDVFNRIWGVKQGRPFVRKLIDYTAMLFFLPVLMICASGINVLVSSTLQTILHWHFMTPVVHWMLEVVSWILTWLFFGLMYLVIPNTKVKPINAMIAGVFAGTGFLLLQWVFVSGQMYVARYNAIYGSFSFLPLMLIWCQLTWLIILTGGVVCYSSQNIFQYSFNSEIDNISGTYERNLLLAIGCLVVQRFENSDGPTTLPYMVKNYNFPPKLCTLLCDRLVRAGIFSVVIIDEKHDIKGYQPSVDPKVLSVAYVTKKVDSLGATNFVPHFDAEFPGVKSAFAEILQNEEKLTSNILLNELTVNIKK